jgi:hypothetical protein
MRVSHESKKLSAAVALVAATAFLPGCASTESKHESIFETDVTNDLRISSGEPQIAVDPTNSDNLAIVEFSAGSDARPISTDGGKTFRIAQSANTPVDRPWLTVDSSTGTVYTVSSGQYNSGTGKHNVPGPDAPNDRWLVAWEPHLAAKSEPRRIGGPDFSRSGGNTIAAAHGVIAATFVLGGPSPGAGFTGAMPPPVHVPQSLQNIMKDGVTSCSMQAPCLFFETSPDQGRHWTRYHVPVSSGLNPQRANLTADPGRPRRYAISVLSPDRMRLLVIVTDDSGATWSAPAVVPEVASGENFKQWMAYGPTGVLGLVWKKQRDDLSSPSHSAPQSEGLDRSAIGPAFDVYAAISCDGGMNWLPAVRVNSETSPAGPVGMDDLSYIALDAHFAHLVWGDRRMLPKVSNVPGGMGGLQAYYGRVPFSTVSHGASCGRS